MNQTKKLTLAALIVALSVIGNSLVVIPIGIIKAAPIQHLMNVLTAILLGPAYAVGTAFVTSLIRNAIGTGSIFAFPGSLIGALCAGLIYARTKRIGLTALGEFIGTGIIGGLVSTAIATLFMGKEGALVLFLPSFLASAGVGAAIAYLLALGMVRKGIIKGKDV